MGFAGSFLPQHRIKGYQFENVDRLQLQLVRNPINPFVADKTEMFLPEMQQWQSRASFSLGRVLSNCSIHLPL